MRKKKNGTKMNQDEIRWKRRKKKKEKKDKGEGEITETARV